MGGAEECPQAVRTIAATMEPMRALVLPSVMWLALLAPARRD